LPVKYIDVTAISDLFVPATRAFGDIAIVGKGRANTPASAPIEFTNPTDAIAKYPVARSVNDGVLNGTTTITSATANFVPSDVGRPVTGVGIPSGATIATVSTVTTILLSSTATATASAVSLTFGAKPNENTDLAAAIAIAFRQSPPPTLVWGVQVDATTPLWGLALEAVANLDVQIVVLANTPLNVANVTTLTQLVTHVVSVSNTGGDGKERIGVAMLDPTLPADQAPVLNAGAIKNERMFLVAHKSTEDAAAAASGVIAGYEPHISVLLKPIRINMIDTFSDGDIDTFYRAAVNWVTSPILIPGHGLFLGEGLTADPSQNKKYIDIVRTIDDVNFRIKAELIRAIGNFRVSRSGLRSIATLVQSVLSPLVNLQVIEDYLVYIPLLVLLDKDPNTLSTGELTQIQQAQATRSVDIVATVTYAGAIHRLHVKLVFK
jgi:hypothetical protein